LLKPQAFTQDIANRLEQAMDHLAELSRTRSRSAFDVILSGKVGVGGIYDLLRRIRALLKREQFTRQHGSEDF
jgi:hypothetical protein